MVMEKFKGVKQFCLLLEITRLIATFYVCIKGSLDLLVQGGFGRPFDSDVDLVVQVA